MIRSTLKKNLIRAGRYLVSLQYKVHFCNLEILRLQIEKHREGAVKNLIFIANRIKYYIFKGQPEIYRHTDKDKLYKGAKQLPDKERVRE